MVVVRWKLGGFGPKRNLSNRLMRLIGLEVDECVGKLGSHNDISINKLSNDPLTAQPYPNQIS